MASEHQASKAPTMNTFEKVLFAGRWILAPIYLCLMIAMAIHSITCFSQLWELAKHCWAMDIRTDEMMIGVLNIVDLSMLGNLVVMVNIGGYSIFVRRLAIVDRLSQPQWLDHLDSTRLKVKMGLSLIGVSSIQLLKDFVDISHVDPEDLYRQIGLHGVFVLSTLAVAVIGKLTQHSPQMTECSDAQVRRILKALASENEAKQAEHSEH